ncbi:MAG: FHA domain-containing protein [Chloroflexi bacterium]|nr:MAG: FHA domain-containing protein [Chloroflexota bacterium]
MIICPNCQNPEMPGAVFCQRCGTNLDSLLQSQPSAPSFDKMYKSPSEQAPMVNISLSIMDAGQVLPLLGKNEYTIGRISLDQPVLPDVDLSSYLAYEKGVSRMHISVRISGRKVTVTDLGSINGTQLNGKKILPNQSYPLDHGDTLTLGKMKVQVLIREK